jgi:hypothetical protein
MGSPAFMDSREDFARTGSAGIASEGQQGYIVDRSSQATSTTSYDARSYDGRSTVGSTMTSDYYPEVQTPWTPMSGGDVGTPDRGRAPSSVYTMSVRAPSRGRSTGFFPGAGTTYKPSKAKLGHAAGPTSEWASPRTPSLPRRRPESISKLDAMAGGIDGLGDLPPPRAPGMSSRPVEDRDSTVTVFPGANYLDSPPRKPSPQAAAGAHREDADPAAATNDMSWLNLRAV